MIADLKEIEIYNIKNINLIYFYIKPFQNKESDSFYTGLKVVYQNSSKTVEYDYKSPYYEMFCHHVLSLYEHEKHEHKVILLGEFTNEVINNYHLIKDDKLDFSIPTLCEETIPKNDKFSELYEIIEPFLMEAFQYILYCFYPNQQVKIDSVTHLKNRYMFHFEQPMEAYIPFMISNRNNEYVIKTQLYQKNRILPIEIRIENKLDRITTYWNFEDYDLCGHIISMITNDTVSYESAVVSDGTIIFLEKDNIKVVDDEAIKQKIRFYLSLSNIDMEDANIYKLSTEIEQYAIVNSIFDETEEKKSCVLMKFCENGVIVDMKKELLFHDQQYNLDVMLDNVECTDTYSLETSQDYSILKKRRKFKDSMSLQRLTREKDECFSYENFELPYYESIEKIDYGIMDDASKIYERKVK